MLVRVVRDWAYPSSFLKQTPAGLGHWDNVVFTEEKVEKCDVLIVLQRPPYKITVDCPKGNRWLVTQESPDPWFDFYKRSFKYFDKVFTVFKDSKHTNIISYQPLLPWHVDKSYDELTSLTIDKALDSNKKDEVSWITSNRTGRIGHKARMQFKDFLFDKGFQFHLMGAGFKHIDDKFDGLYPYKYSIAVENYFCEDYWTEKIADCFLSWTMPIYCGCTNILDYFPEGSMIIIDVNKPNEAYKIILDAIKNKRWDSSLKEIETSRNLILNEYQFFPQVVKMIGKYNVEENNNFQKIVVPKNDFPLRQTMGNQINYYYKRILRALGLKKK